MVIDKKNEVNGMLLQFKFENYRCFAEETIFNMVAAPIKDHSNSLNEQNGVYVLPISAIYGANASGKTSFFMAFNSMRNAILSGVFDDYNNLDSNYSLLTTPFLFTGDPSKITDALSQPTVFEVTFAIGDYAYRYGFECTQKVVRSEWLYKQKISRNPTTEKMIYKYSYNSKNISHDKLNKKMEDEIEYCFSMRSNNKLLLSDFGRREKDSELTNIFVWFLGMGVLLNSTTDIMCRRGYQDLVGKVFDDDNGLFNEEIWNKNELRKRIVDLVSDIDPSIKSIKQTNEINQNGQKKYKLLALHEKDNFSYSVPFDLESDGTKKYLFLSIMILTSLKTGTPLLIDELDAKFHPLLLRKIVQFYNNKQYNSNNAQLIFSAHNIINLNSSDLRRDEIWFVEKNNQKSTMYSLYDFNDDDEKIRSDLDYGKHYLSGRFGAVPFQD